MEIAIAICCTHMSKKGCHQQISDWYLNISRKGIRDEHDRKPLSVLCFEERQHLNILKEDM